MCHRHLSTEKEFFLLLALDARWPFWTVPPMPVPINVSDVMGPDGWSTWCRSILAWAGAAVLVWSWICCGCGESVTGSGLLVVGWLGASVMEDWG